MSAASLNIIRMTVFLATVNHTSARLFPVMMVYVLSLIFSFQFRNVEDRLRRGLKKSRGMSLFEMEDIRQNHQRLCRMLERADGLFTIHYTAALLGPLISVILQLYIIVKYPDVFQNNALLIFVCSTWLSLGIGELLITGGGAMRVNHYVRDHYIQLHRFISHYTHN